MARIVNSINKPCLSLVVTTVLTNGDKLEKVLKIDDMVDGLRYVENGQIKTVTGRVSNISYTKSAISRNYLSMRNLKSYFSTDVKPKFIEIDCSTEFHSNIVKIPVMELIEDLGVSGVEKMTCRLEYGISVTVSLSDGTTDTLVINEGQVVNDLVYISKSGEKVVDAKIVAFTTDKDLNPVKVHTITNSRILTLDVLQLKDIGTVDSVVVPGSSIQFALDNATADSVYFSAGKFEEPMTINKTINISGAKAGVGLAYRNKETLEGETIIDGKIDVAAGTSVSLDGVALTGNALVSLVDAGTVSMKNCIITNLTADDGGKCVFVASSATEPTKLTINGCYFGNNSTADEKGFKNTLELGCKLADGSYFSNNYFADKCSRNNDICIYDVEDGAVITVAHNTWEKSANGIRVGTKFDANCIINIKSNTYYATDDTEEWAGLLLVQPYGAATTNMSGVTINISNTTKPEKPEQLFYLYSAGSDMPFTKETLPTIMVDGVEQDLTKYITITE